MPSAGGKHVQHPTGRKGALALLVGCVRDFDLVVSPRGDPQRHEYHSKEARRGFDLTVS